MVFHPSELLLWWTVSITWSAFFLIMVSLYLYWDRRKRYPQGSQIPRHYRTDFVFVWVLIGLLALYIVSIYRSSSAIFLAGNVIVEIALIAYATRNKK